MANTLAYCAKDYITAVKKFYETSQSYPSSDEKSKKDFSQRLANEGSYSQHFTFFVTYEWAQ
jgi:hypothetical protein